MKIEEFIYELKEAKRTGIKYKLFKNVFPDVPSFDSFIEYKDWSKEHGRYRSDRPGFYILHSDNPLTELHGMGEYSLFHKTIKSVYEDLGDTDHFGVTLVISEYTREEKDVSGITKHTDQTDTIHWSGPGYTVWTIYDGEEELEFRVEPGDVFFARKDTIHGVESLTQRAGIVVSAGAWSENFDPDKRY